MEIDAAIHRVLDSGWFILGKEVESFETEFASWVGGRYACGVGSGTDAVEIALRACGVGPGDAVFTVSHTAVATVAAIERAGATPVWVDIEPWTYGMDPVSLEQAVQREPAAQTGSPKAVVAVHLYGQPCDMDRIVRVARRYGLKIIEDCAQAHGAEIGGQKCGTLGDAAAFSFYPTKNLGALGDGGAIVISDPQIAERVKLFRQYGWKERYISAVPGGNSRLDEIQAAVLRAKLPVLARENARRREIAAFYDEQLQGTGLLLPTCRRHAVHVYHQYVVRTSHRDALQMFLRERGIGSAVHYPQPVHLQPAYADRFPRLVPLRQSEDVCRTVLSLPMYPELSQAQIQGVVETLKEASQTIGVGTLS